VPIRVNGRRGGDAARRAEENLRGHPGRGARCSCTSCGRAEVGDPRRGFSVDATPSWRARSEGLLGRGHAHDRLCLRRWTSSSRCWSWRSAIAALQATGRPGARRRGRAPARAPSSASASARTPAHALAAHAAGAAPQASPHARLVQAAAEEFTELARRRLFRDDSGHHWRPRALRGAVGGRDRPPRRDATRARRSRALRDAAPRGLSQGAAPLELAAKFGKPSSSSSTRPAPIRGWAAEEPRQAERSRAICDAWRSLPTPIVAVVTARGGSAALAIGMGNRVLMARARRLLRDLARGLRGDPLG